MYSVAPFHPWCLFGDTRPPCVIALMRDIVTNEPRAIQRTAMADGERIGRMMLGPKIGAVIELKPGETSLRFLQRVYRSVRQPMSRRMRAAIEAPPFERPKLSAVATAAMNGGDFASMLERAIERSGKTRLIEGTCEEAQVPRLEAPGGAAIKRRSIP
jgi:hypothetical protein